MDCLFCKIVAGDIPSTKVYEDACAFAFLDITPVNPGHILLVPKEHSENLYEMPDELLAAMAPVVKKLAIAVKDATGAQGINLGMNNDPAAGQVIFHAHIHIIPRFKNDGHKHWQGKPYQDGEIEGIATNIRMKL